MIISFEYILVLFFFFFNAIVFLLLVGIAFICGKRSKDFSKLSAYECGFKSFSDTRRPFDVHFYLISILYLIFDLEALYLFPFVVAIPSMNIFGFIAVFLFLSLIILGFVFDWRQGALF
jgi:NADH-quinone oxidoreductase subunit A